MAKPAPERPTFESALEQLTEIVSALEGGDLPLEEAITRYENGVRLLRYCREQLSAAEERVRIVDEELSASGVDGLDEVQEADEYAPLDEMEPPDDEEMSFADEVREAPVAAVVRPRKGRRRDGR